MKVFVSGSRSINNKELIKSKLIKYKDEEILVGDCYGVDSVVQSVCKDLDIKFIVYHIGNYPRHCLGKSIKVEGCKYVDKDIVMSNDCDCGLVFWDSVSRGSKNNIERLKRMNKVVEVIYA